MCNRRAFRTTGSIRQTNGPQEAIIRITYAVASAAVILAMSKATGEAAHLRDMLVGNILSGSVVGCLADGGDLSRHRGVPLGFRKRFLEISADPVSVAARGMSVRFWDFLLYASFGFVVTRSVAIAGSSWCSAI
jgi:zinc/manganese transport system permease protein